MNKCLNCDNDCAKVYCSNKCQITYQRKIKLESGKADLRTIKSFLIKRDGNICSSCLLSEWLGQIIPLVADHIDGNADNSTLKNIRLICNNCDALSSTFKGRNKGNGRTIRRYACII